MSACWLGRSCRCCIEAELGGRGRPDTFEAVIAEWNWRSSSDVFSLCVRRIADVSDLNELLNARRMSSSCSSLDSVGEAKQVRVKQLLGAEEHEEGGRQSNGGSDHYDVANDHLLL